MTECERLISTGELESGFLQDENRCDYHIESKMKKLWALQIDLVKQIETICKAHNLSFFLIGGGCIGAVRHNGCIPWDDDIDVALKREDYNKLIEIAQKELTSPYFLQTPITDPAFYRPFAVMRNGNGTCISRGDQKLGCNNGICIHIFPLDGYEDNLECKLFRFVSHYKNLVAVTSYNARSAGNHKILRKIIRLTWFIVFPFGLKRYFYKFNRRCTILSRKYQKRIGIQYTHFDRRNCWTWDADLFDSVIDVPFEYTTLPIPIGYHKMLTEVFGEYMQFPPTDERGNKHSFEIEPDIPYKKYCQEKYGTTYRAY